MTQVTIKGHTFTAIAAKDSFHRRAIQYANKILATLCQLGLTEDDVDVPLETLAIKRSSASATWFFEGYRMHYSYQGGKFVDNLYVVFKVIDLEVHALINNHKTFHEFISEFTEDEEVEAQRKEARELLGVNADCIDLDLIDKKYKDLARKLHPDMDGGDIDKFKALNRAHKLLRRELL